MFNLSWITTLEQPWKKFLLLASKGEILLSSTLGAEYLSRKRELGTRLAASRRVSRVSLSFTSGKSISKSSGGGLRESESEQASERRACPRDSKRVHPPAAPFQYTSRYRSRYFHFTGWHFTLRSRARVFSNQNFVLCSAVPSTPVYRPTPFNSIERP